MQSAFYFFFFNDTATTEIYTLSLHDALPICPPTTSIFRSPVRSSPASSEKGAIVYRVLHMLGVRDRKSTRLNSSHLVISYAVFCLKKKKQYRSKSSTPAIITPVTTLQRCLSH